MTNLTFNICFNWNYQQGKTARYLDSLTSKNQRSFSKIKENKKTIEVQVLNCCCYVGIHRELAELKESGKKRPQSLMPAVNTPPNKAKKRVTIAVER